jgi:hypothetical protein
MLRRKRVRTPRQGPVTVQIVHYDDPLAQSRQRAEEALQGLARLIGRQMAREAFQKRRDEEADLIRRLAAIDREMAATYREMAREVPDDSETRDKLLEVAALYESLAEVRLATLARQEPVMTVSPTAEPS